MRRKYGDCQRADGDCTACSLVNYGRDCHNNPITNLEWYRRAAGLSQKELSEASGVNIRQIQRVELGEAEAGNLTAKNLLAIADALGVELRRLI
jgi:DNA-binding Xre family transcriptional regulator|nr:MAG TPA: helix-turn-helix domain protein [Caudoviricetes sp.]DAZ58475.1 MAG TPA: helix-turn-helix domain protein [Caudoviricetes sp.]